MPPATPSEPRVRLSSPKGGLYAHSLGGCKGNTEAICCTWPAAPEPAAGLSAVVLATAEAAGCHRSRSKGLAPGHREVYFVVGVAAGSGVFTKPSFSHIFG
jgi:hypothetical protein